jgi:hypothetical protein
VITGAFIAFSGPTQAAGFGELAAQPAINASAQALSRAIDALGQYGMGG